MLYGEEKWRCEEQVTRQLLYTGWVVVAHLKRRGGRTLVRSGMTSLGAGPDDVHQCGRSEREHAHWL